MNKQIKLDFGKDFETQNLGNVEEKLENVTLETKTLIEDIFELDKCPNCDEISYNNKFGCKNCGYGVDINYKEYEKFFSNLNKKEETKKLNKKIRYKSGDFEIYKVVLNGNKIEKVLFKFKGSKFIIDIDYQIFNKNIKEKIYTENEKEFRLLVYNILKIQNLKINYISKKVNNGYGEKKQNANYFQFMGLNNIILLKFLEEFLKSQAL